MFVSIHHVDSCDVAVNGKACNECLGMRGWPIKTAKLLGLHLEPLLQPQNLSLLYITSQTTLLPQETPGDTSQPTTCLKHSQNSKRCAPRHPQDPRMEYTWTRANILPVPRQARRSPAQWVTQGDGHVTRIRCKY